MEVVVDALRHCHGMPSERRNLLRADIVQERVRYPRMAEIVRRHAEFHFLGNPAKLGIYPSCRKGLAFPIHKQPARTSGPQQGAMRHGKRIGVEINNPFALRLFSALRFIDRENPRIPVDVADFHKSRLLWARPGIVQRVNELLERIIFVDDRKNLVDLFGQQIRFIATGLTAGRSAFFAGFGPL